MTFGDFGRDFGQANLFFSGPSSTTERHNMTIKRSADGGESFGDALVVYPGASAYSCLASLRGADEIGILFEHGRGSSPYGTLSFSRVPMDF